MQSAAAATSHSAASAITFFCDIFIYFAFIRDYTHQHTHQLHIPTNIHIVCMRVDVASLRPLLNYAHLWDYICTYVYPPTCTLHTTAPHTQKSMQSTLTHRAARQYLFANTHKHTHTHTQRPNNPIDMHTTSTYAPRHTAPRTHQL